MKKYSIERLTMAQVPAVEIDKELLLAMENRASYVDADNQLGESLVTVDTLLEIETEALEQGNVRLAALSIELHKQIKKYNYVQLAKV